NSGAALPDCPVRGSNGAAIIVVPLRNTISWPARVQRGSRPPVVDTWRNDDDGDAHGRTYTSERPDSVEMKAIHRPSGENIGVISSRTCGKAGNSRRTVSRERKRISRPFCN